MEANWFPEHLEAGAKVFEAEIAALESSPTKEPSELTDELDRLRYYVQELRKYKSWGSKAVQGWLGTDGLIRRKMTPEGARQMGIFRTHLEKSVEPPK